MAQDSPLPGLVEAGGIDIWMLWLKVMATGASTSLLILLAVFAASLYRHRDEAAPVALHFMLVNLFATLYVAADTLVRVNVVLDRADTAVLPYRLSLAAVALAVGAYVNLYRTLARRRAGRLPRLLGTYLVAILLAASIWIDHPGLILASDRMIAAGGTVFADYGAAAPFFFGLCLTTFAVISYRILRLAARIENGPAWGLTVFGFAVFFLAGLHDALRELGFGMLPLDTLTLGCTGFQIGAFAVMAMHYSRTLGERARQGVQLRRLTDEVTRDPLSGLFNRAYLENRLDRLGEDARGGLLFIDLDRFKAINDRFGHWHGDRLIQIAAERIRGGIRDGDIPCRWGGDEFVVYLSDLNAEAVRPVVQRLAAILNDGAIDDLPEVELRASMGFAELTDGDWRTTLDRADQALYEAKRAGRNRLRIA